MLNPYTAEFAPEAPTPVDEDQALLADQDFKCACCRKDLKGKDKPAKRTGWHIVCPPCFRKYN